MRIKFTTHAASRIANRKNIKVSTNQEYNIAAMGFVRSPATGRTPDGTPVDYWINPDRKELLLMVVDPEQCRVLTILDEWKGVVPISYRLYEAQRVS